MHTQYKTAFVVAIAYLFYRDLLWLCITQYKISPFLLLPLLISFTVISVYLLYCVSMLCSLVSSKVWWHAATLFIYFTLFEDTYNNYEILLLVQWPSWFPHGFSSVEGLLTVSRRATIWATPHPILSLAAPLVFALVFPMDCSLVCCMLRSMFRSMLCSLVCSLFATWFVPWFSPWIASWFPHGFVP